MSIQSSSTDQSLNISNQNQNYSSYSGNNNIYYYNNLQKNIKNIINNPKVIKNKLLPQKESVYSIYQPDKKIMRNNESFNTRIKKEFNEDSSFYSQKPIQTFELNLNVNNNINKTSNIVNIDNQSSAFELFFMAKKKPKNNFKISAIYQIGLEQKPLSLTFLAEKKNKKAENNNINNNTSFISNRLMENNSYVENEINIINNNISNKKNELKIMQNPGRKSENKPKPVLQIMTNSNKNNFSKKLSESNLPNINGFSLEDSLKNNFGNISKSASMIVNNNNQDISFISNSKETENFLEMNDNYNNKNNLLLGIENNNNVYNGYIMINQQLCFIGDKNNNNINNISNTSFNNSINKSNAKKYIKIEYYDSQPVTFEILSEFSLQENMKEMNYNYKVKKINEIKLCPYKMFRVEEMQFIKENKENEEKNVDKEENNKSFNNNKKKRRRRKKK